MQIGQTLAFGDHLWQVLDIKDDCTLLITRNIIALRVYHNAPGDIAWADCSLRSFLNGDFYNSFLPQDRAKIVPVALQTPNNPWFGTNGGELTNDLIFLLSIEEAVCNCFGDSSKNLAVPNGKYKYWFAKKDINNPRRTAQYLDCPWWWLRSPGRKQAKVAYVHGDGNIGMQGNNAHKCNIKSVFHPITNDVKGGVRPALWIEL